LNPECFDNTHRPAATGQSTSGKCQREKSALPADH
jgi:hypothetical protein